MCSKLLHRCEQIPSDHQCYEFFSSNHHLPRMTTDQEIVQIFLNQYARFIEAAQPTTSERCLVWLRLLLCLNEFPVCDFHTSEALPLCLEQCPEIDTLSEECNHFLNSSELQSLEFAIPYIESFNCSDPRTYYAYFYVPHFLDTSCGMSSINT